jgi:hypothetical protein
LPQHWKLVEKRQCTYICLCQNVQNSSHILPKRAEIFNGISSIISAMYCYRSLYMNQIPGIYYLYARLIKQKCIRIPLLYSKRIDSGIKNQYAIKVKSNLYKYTYTVAFLQVSNAEANKLYIFRLCCICIYQYLILM